MAENNNNALVGALLLVAGGIIGAGAALLFAPQSGRQTRKDIARYSRKVKRKAGDLVDDFSDTVSGLVETVGEKASEIIEQGKDLAQDAKRDVLQAVEEGQQMLEKQKSRLARFFS
jgi:gas vesicle protein